MPSFRTGTFGRNYYRLIRLPDNFVIFQLSIFPSKDWIIGRDMSAIWEGATFAHIKTFQNYLYNLWAVLDLGRKLQIIFYRSNLRQEHKRIALDIMSSFISIRHFLF